MGFALLGGGGEVKGSSSSQASQDAIVNFIPSVTENTEQPLVSVYPAGQGLQTINDALPASAAYNPATYAVPYGYSTSETLTTSASPASSSSSSSSSTLLLLVVIGAGAFLLLRKGKL